MTYLSLHSLALLHIDGLLLGGGWSLHGLGLADPMRGLKRLKESVAIDAGR